jgi:hypothetical protein
MNLRIDLLLYRRLRGRLSLRRRNWPLRVKAGALPAPPLATLAGVKQGLSDSVDGQATGIIAIQPPSVRLPAKNVPVCLRNRVATVGLLRL